ncbi:hypothetical protein BJ944DRAFT_122744 [Cunninghamella echinulata]|nr:hypothetical protein BJ944DRAFT_122744 [Cunninghamella echinulata]
MSLPSPLNSAVQQTTIDTTESTNNDIKGNSTCESAVSIVTIDIEQTVHHQESNKSKESSSIQNQSDLTTQQDFIFEKEMNYVNENDDDDIPLGKMPIKLTYSNMLHHDRGKRGVTNKDAVISAWIDNVTHTPTMTYDSYNNNTSEAAHIYDLDQPYTPSHYQQQGDDDMDNDNATLMEERPIIQETKDVFTDAQKLAYVGLCAVTSLEVVHDFKGKEFTYARMSADNWQRKLMRAIYMHMDISPEEIKMIESLSKHDILPTDFVFQFTSQGETATVNVKDFKGKPSKIEKKVASNEDSSNTNKPNENNNNNNNNNDENIGYNNNNRNYNDDITRHSQKIEIENEIENETFYLESLPPLPPSPTNSSIHNSFDDDLPLSDSLSSLSSFMANNNHVENEEEQRLDKNNTCSSSTSRPNRAIKKGEETTPDQFVIDLRWTVMCDLYLICLSLENYDARSRVFIQCIANYFSLDYHHVLSFERRITDHLIQMEGAWETQSTMTASTTLTSLTNTTTMVDPTQLSNKRERTSRNNQRKKKRYVMIGLATIGGGLILGLSAGLMAPVIAGGLGALLTTVGVTGTSTFLGGTAGIGLITGAATLAGSRIGAVSMNKRMKTINTFEFIPVHVHHQAHCIISITGWLPKTDDKEGSSILPFSTLDPIMGDHYNLFWEPEMLEELGSAFKIFATEAVTFSVQQALGHTIMGALLAGLAWPLALTKLGYLVDNPWANGLDRARSAGLVLADALMNRNVGARPVTLIGYSLGARVIFYCLEELARVHAFGLVENVALFGTPVSASKSQWRECTSIVSGRFINGYATNDWLLGFLFRATNAASTVIGNNVAGLHPLEMIQGNRVQNLDCTDLIKGHLSYRMAMPKLLKRAGFFITSEDIIENKEKESNMKKSSSQQEVLENDSPHMASSLSSLSSGKASIQLPNKSTSLVSNNENDDSKENPTGSVSTSSSINKEGKEQQMVISNTTTTTAPNTATATTNDTSNQKIKSDTVSGDITDMDIIADILANATAAAALNKNGTYSSISSGKASITSTPTTKTNQSNRASGFFKGFTRSRSDTTTSMSSNQSKTENTNSQPAKSHSSSSFNPATPKKSTSITSTFWSRKSTTKPPEIEEMGVEVKEIKTTLGKMVVPGEVVHPMPKINLEMPQHARINR